MKTRSGFHVHFTVVDDQISSFHQWNSHLSGQERMFIIGRIVNPGSEQYNIRVGNFSWRHGNQYIVKNHRIICHHTHIIRSKHFRKNSFRDFAVFQHITYAARTPQIVFQYIKLSLCTPNQINSRNVNVNVVRHFYSMHLLNVMWARSYQCCRDNTFFYDKLFVVNVFQEQVECL